MPAVSCRCRFPSFLYRVYQPTLRRAEVSPRWAHSFREARGQRNPRLSGGPQKRETGSTNILIGRAGETTRPFAVVSCPTRVAD